MVVRITSRCAATAMARSISPSGVTQTGQPGPERSRTPGGGSWRMPWRKIATVWVPQTSMSVIGRGTCPDLATSSTRRAMLVTSAAATAGS